MGHGIEFNRFCPVLLFPVCPIKKETIPKSIDIRDFFGRLNFGERYYDDLCRRRLNRKSVVRIAIIAAARYSDDKNAILTTKRYSDDKKRNFSYNLKV